MSLAARSAFGLLAIWALTSCDNRICGDADPVNVAGDWLVTGSGQCLDTTDVDSEIEFEAQTTLAVSQSADGRTLFISEPATIDGTSFDFAGTVDGSCVDFTIEEDGPGGRVAYVFRGVLNDGSLSGDVSGEGERVCPFEGSFDIAILGGSVGTRPDGGIPDAGTSSTSTTTPLYGDECVRTEDCEVGICERGECVILCTSSPECATGQKCTDGRCTRAQGCNCDTTEGSSTWWPALALLLALGRSARRRGREPRAWT